MKKFAYLLSILLVVSANNSIAQNHQNLSSGSSSGLSSDRAQQNLSPEKISEKKEHKQKRQERYEKASPEEKQRIDKHREIMKNLTPEQRELVKKERERHRQEMKKITGVDLQNEGSSAQ